MNEGKNRKEQNGFVDSVSSFFTFGLSIFIIAFLAIIGYSIWDNILGPMIGKPYFKTFIIAALAYCIVLGIKGLFLHKVYMLRSATIRFFLWGAITGFLLDFFGK